MLVLLTWAAPALACGVMEKAEPRVGSTVPAVDRLRLEFSQPVAPAASSIVLTDGGGNAVKTGTPEGSAGGTAMSVAVPALAPGRYKVAWKVFWPDCDSTSQGDYGFTVR